jgi:hypothetical protein
MCRRVRALVLLRRRVSLCVMLLVNYTRGSRVLLQVLGRRLTLLLVLRVMRIDPGLLLELAGDLAIR